MTIASLVEAEGRGDDMPKIARVIYNRLETRLRRPTGCSRSTRRSTTPRPATTRRRRRPTSRPPDRLAVQHLQVPRPAAGPIEAPGDAAIQAAPTRRDGDWYYYVTVNLKTGETKFAETYDEFLQYKESCREYCENESAVLLRPRPPMRCAVLGDPIAHSLSPALHRAAYAAPAWTGPTTRSGSPTAAWPGSWPASTRPGAGCR